MGGAKDTWPLQGGKGFCVPGFRGSGDLCYTSNPRLCKGHLLQVTKAQMIQGPTYTRLIVSHEQTENRMVAIRAEQRRDREQARPGAESQLGMMGRVLWLHSLP